MQTICDTFNVSQQLLCGTVGVVLMLANLAVAHWFGMKMMKL